jgi:hypothetical protein
MDATNPYLNPVELFDLADKPGLKAADLRKAKKRFLTELELDEREDFDYHGRLFTRNDLDRVSQEAEDDAMLEAYVAAAEARGLSAFLTSGQTDHVFDRAQLFNPRLGPILKSYFGPAFNQAFGRAVAAKDEKTVSKMVLWKAESAGIPPSELYQDAYRNLDTKIDTLAGTVDAYLRDPKSRAAQNLKGMKAFEDNFPKTLVSVLPPYFSDLTNKLADRLTPYIIRLNNERQNPRLALALTKSILRLEYLSDDKRTSLKKIGRQLRDNVNTAKHNREAQSRGSDGSGVVGVGRIIWMIIVVVVMLFRIASCVSSNNRSSRTNYRTSSPYAQQYKMAPPVDYQERYAMNLRRSVRNGRSPAAVTPDQRANISPALLAPIYSPGAGVQEANQVLKAIAEDTVYHIDGNVMYRPTLPFEPVELFEKTTKRKLVPKDKDTSKLYLTLVELNKDLVDKEHLREEMQIAERLERQQRAEKAKEAQKATEKERLASLAAEKKANSDALAKLGAKALHKEPQKDILGPKARMPANYSLLLKSTLSDRERLFIHGPLKKIKVGIDDPEVGTILVWRDTFGLRQVRISSTRSIPLVFKVATGKIDKLLESYVVYGKRWSDEEISPFGGQGWYREVLCYCGPNDHQLFINGKKATRKNLWFPAKKVDTSKSMSPNAWLRGVKRLR